MTQLEAERAIAKILSELETDSGSLVESLHLHNIETTNAESYRQEQQTNVVILMRRTPGRNWAT